jgi:hypothetical protein
MIQRMIFSIETNALVTLLLSMSVKIVFYIRHDTWTIHLLLNKVSG